MKTTSEKAAYKPESSVSRSLKLPCLQDGNCGSKRVEDCLENIDGVQKVKVDSVRSRVWFTYDTVHLVYTDIQQALVAANYPVTVNTWSRIKSGWYDYIDGNMRANALSTGQGSCCSNPTDIYVNKRK